MSMSCLICWQHTITIILKYEHNEEEEQDATLVLVEIIKSWHCLSSGI